MTGANSGIGYHTAVELARKGSSIILACRNPAKAEDALKRLKAEVPTAKVELAALDLSDLKSVRAFGSAFAGRGIALDLLINNAGIMAPLRPARFRRTASRSRWRPIISAISC